MDTSMKVKHKVSLFLGLHNDISKNLLLPNVGTFNVFRERFEDARNLGETSYMASITHRTWMHHAQDPSWGTRSSKRNTRFIDIPIVLYWKGRNFFILSVVEVNEHLMEKLV